MVSVFKTSFIGIFSSRHKINIRNTHQSKKAITMITALVPLKGESERVKNKNMRLFAGKPLCHHILKTLADCSCIDRIVVNTDAEDIAEYVKNFKKVHVSMRIPSLQGHDVPMNDIIRWELEHDKDCNSGHYLQTHATNPLLSAKTIATAAAAYLNNLNIHDALFSVTGRQVRLFTREGVALNHNPKILLNTQNLPIIYEENSCMYFFSRSTICTAGSRTGLKPYMFPISILEASDIDTEEDFFISEALFCALKNHKQTTL